MFIISDRVKETSTTTGVGDLVLNGAYGAFQTFSDAIGDGNTTYYTIENNSKWEVGQGVYTASSNSISRDIIFDSSAGGSKITLEGVSIVFCTLPASKAFIKDPDGGVQAVDVVSTRDGNIKDLTVDTILVSGDSNLQGSISVDGDAVLGGDTLVSGDLSVIGDLDLDEINAKFLTLTRPNSAGNFFHAYKDDGTNQTVGLWVDNNISPLWRLGLKTNPSDQTATPTFGYIFGRDGSVGSVSDTSNYFSIANTLGFSVQHQGNLVLRASSDTGVYVDSQSAFYPAFTIQGATLNTSDLQRWEDSLGVTLSVIDSGGKIGVLTDTPIYELDVNGSGRMETITLTSGIYFQDGTFQDSAFDITPVSGWVAETITNGDNAVSGWAASTFLTSDDDSIANFASGLAVQNELDIVTVSGLLGDSEVANFASGLAVQNELDISTVSGLLTPSGESFDFVGNVLTYNNSDGGSFTADLSSLSTFDTSGVSLDYSAGTLTYTNNAGGSFDVDLSSISGDVYAMIVDGAPTTLDTLNEIAAALNDDENIASTLTNLITNTSGNLQSQIISNDGDITQLNSDIVTVSGLLGSVSGTPSGVAFFGDDELLTDDTSLTFDPTSVGLILAKSSASQTGIKMQTTGGEHGLHVEGNVQTIRSYNRTKIYTGSSEIFDSRSSPGAEIAAAVPHFKRGLTAYTIGTSYPAAVIKGASAQSADLIEWRNNSDDTLSSVDSNGIYTNIIGSSGTDTLRIKYGDAQINQTTMTDTDIVGVWLDFEDGTEYTNGSLNSNGLILGTWYNTAKTARTYAQITGGYIRFEIANGLRFILSPSLARFQADVRPYQHGIWDLGSAAYQWKNIYASGTVYASGLVASGVELRSHVPTDTANKLYNEGGTLKFDGSEIGGNVTGTPSGVGFFDDGGSLSGNNTFIYDGVDVALSGNIVASGKRVITSDEIYHIKQLTQAEYDVITPDSATFYIITDADPSPLVQSYREVSSDDTILSTDHTINATATSVLTLPTAAGNKGLIYNIKNTSTGNVTVSGVSSQTIDGQPTFEISTQNQSIKIQSTDSNWIII